MRSVAILFLSLSLALAGCAGGASNAAAPSFDCAKAVAPADILVCQDPQLARLDTELNANFVRAQNDGDSVPSGYDLRVAQNQWVGLRNSCTAEADPHACLVKAYAARIQQLRMGSGAARSDEEGGSTFGPFAVACEGMSDPLVATFINAEPDVVYISGSIGSLLLTQGMSASGARYVDPGETTVFWNKGDAALFQRPGEADTNCALTRI